MSPEKQMYDPTGGNRIYLWLLCFGIYVCAREYSGLMKEIIITDDYNLLNLDTNSSGQSVNVAFEIPEKLLFLKTYKTGSSTLNTILTRQAMMQNKSVILTANTIGSHLYSTVRNNQYEIFNPDNVPIIGWNKTSRHYEMIINHMTYNFTFAEEHFKDAFKFTILRNPASLLTSSWNYYFTTIYRQTNRFKIKKLYPGIQEESKERVDILYRLIQEPEKFYNFALAARGEFSRHLIRPQLYSFFGPQVYERELSKSSVKQMISKIQKEFKVVMIMEYFDLSLALLSLELNWLPEELAYIHMNGGQRFTAIGKEYHEELVRVINYPDFMLYEHFNRTFWNRVNEIGFDVVNDRSEEIVKCSKKLVERCQDGDEFFKNWGGDRIMKPKLKDEMINDTYCELTVGVGNDLSAKLVEYQKTLVSTWD